MWQVLWTAGKNNIISCKLFFAAFQNPQRVLPIAVHFAAVTADRLPAQPQHKWGLGSLTKPGSFGH